MGTGELQPQSAARTKGDGTPVLHLLPLVLVAAPLVVLPGHVDFSRLPQQAFVQLSALVLGGLWVARGGPSAPGQTRTLDLPLLVFLAWSALSLLFAVDSPAGLRTLGHWCACALAYVLVSRVARRADVLRLGAALLLGGAAVAALGLGQGLLGLDLVPQAVGPAATLANRNVAAGYLVVLAPLALLPWPGRRARVAAAAGAAIILAFLPLTRSRAAAAAVALQLLLLAALREPVPGRPTGHARRRAWALLAGASLVLAAAAWLTVADAAKARSVSIRADLAGAAVAMGLDHPLLGVGLGGFGALFPSYGPVITSPRGNPLQVESPHAEALHVLAETGLPGLLAALWVVAAVVGGLRRLRQSPDPWARRTGLALALGLAGFGVDATFGFPLRSAVPPFVLAVLLGLVSAPGLGAPRDERQPVPQRRPLRLLPAAVLLLVVAAASQSSLLRLEGDGALYRAWLFPVVHAQGLPPGSECGSGLTIGLRAEGRLDLVAHDVPLTDVLRCLVERTGLRLEYDGPPPRQRVRVALQGESLAGTVESLLEGLGVDYLLSRDPSGSGVDRLIVFGGTRAPEPSRAGPRTQAPGSTAEPPPPEAEPDEPTEAPPPERDAPPGVSPGFTPRPEGTFVPEPRGGPERAPAPFAPEELTPLTLQLGRRVGGPVASRGTSPVRSSADRGAGA